MFAPFNATVELAVNPVPNSVTTAAVFTGPEFGEICVSVGAGGFVIDTVSAFEMAGVDVWLLTVMLAVPAVVSRLAGTVAVMDSCPPGPVPNPTLTPFVIDVPFHRTLDVRTISPAYGLAPIDAKRLEPVTVRVVAPDPT
jgi:hypothetical protein